MKGYLYAFTGVILFVSTLLIKTNDQPIETKAINTHKSPSMKMNPGFLTTKLKESKEFYQKVLQFEVVFENEFYILLHTPDGKNSISFLQPDHPSQQPIFQSAFQGKGAYLTFETEDVDAAYKRIKDLGVKIIVEIRDEPWGDRHFAFSDPNGVGIDIVTYKGPSK